MDTAHVGTNQANTCSLELNPVKSHNEEFTAKTKAIFSQRFEQSNVEKPDLSERTISQLDKSSSGLKITASIQYSHDTHPAEVRESLQNLVKECIKEHQFLNFRYLGHDSKSVNEVINILINFVLFHESVVADMPISEGQSYQYVPDKSISPKRFKELQLCLKRMFSEQAARASSIYSVEYSLSAMMRDYLLQQKYSHICSADQYSEQVYSDYLWILHQIFPLSESILSKRVCFSQYSLLFDFVVRFRQSFLKSHYQLATTNIVFILRENIDGIRDKFNDFLSCNFFPQLSSQIIDGMFCDAPSPVAGHEKTTEPPIELMFGEELEYDILPNTLVNNHLSVVNEFKRRFQKIGAKPFKVNNSREMYGFNESFKVRPFHDSVLWLELNCDPYKLPNCEAMYCLNKAIQTFDSMIEDKLIDYSSGHKHVDAMSATQGDSAILLAIDREIQANPYLLRAFGNNLKIMRDHENFWYCTFKDYNPHMAEIARQRLNFLIGEYNKKILAGCPIQTCQNLTDDEKKSRLENFAGFYSQFVHMTTIQHGLGRVTDDNSMEKYRAMSLLHITGANAVQKLGTLEFRFFRCPKSTHEIQLINQFMQAWFEFLHQQRREHCPLEPIPADIRSCIDYLPDEVREKTINYLRKLNLNPEDYSCFWGDVVTIGVRLVVMGESESPDRPDNCLVVMAESELPDRPDSWFEDEWCTY